jgi:DNA-binding beta-propeller fold protein YncE
MTRRTLLALPLSSIALAAGKPPKTIAGNGTAGFSDEQVNNPYGLVTGPDGALYICEIGNHVVRRLDLKSGKLTIAAGNGKQGYSGDGGPAVEASLNEPYEVRFDKSGNMYFVEMRSHLVRRVDGKTKRISTVAGSVEPGFAGDGGPALKAQFKQPHSIEFDRAGNLLVCDIGNNRIRRIDIRSGEITTIFTGSKDTPTNEPRTMCVGPDGTLYVAFRQGNSVYRMKVDGSQPEHIAGTGEKGYSGDGGPAKQAKLSGPKGISLSPDQGVYIADTESHTIRRIDLKNGTIATITGNGQRGPLARPHGVFVDSKGIVYVGDSENHRVLMIS